MSSGSSQPTGTAQIAATVAELLTGSLTTNQRASTVDSEETVALTQAMARLLLGTPLRSDGKLTVKSLAAEAGLRRNKLTHKHTGLKDLFYALVKTHHRQPAIVVDLHDDSDQLRKTIAELRHTNHEQAETIKQFARVVHVLEVENQQLREHAAAAHPVPNNGNVRLLRAPAPHNGQSGAAALDTDVAVGEPETGVEDQETVGQETI